MRGQATAVLLLIVLGSCAGEPAVPPRPNLVLVTVDTLRADHMEAYA